MIVNKFWSFVNIDFEHEVQNFKKWLIRLRIFYFFVLIQSIVICARTFTYFNLNSPQILDVWFFDYIKHDYTIFVLISILLLSSVAYTCFQPLNFLSRLLSFFGTVLILGFYYSFQYKIDHHFHSIVFSLLALTMFSSRSSTEVEKRTVLKSYWFSIALFLLPYSLAGLAKLYGFLVEYELFGHHSIYNKDILALHIAAHWEHFSTSPLASFFIKFPWSGYSLHLFVILIEVFAFPAAFFPRYTKLFGLGLIGMHIGIYFTMNINFLNVIPFIILLIVLNPLKNKYFLGRG